MDLFIDAVKIVGGIFLSIVAAIFLISLPWLIWGGGRVADIKLAAPKVWQQQGFEIVGYEGYELTLGGRPGGCVWYVVRRGQTDYHGCVSRWGDEYHIYNLRALNAIKGN
jgi:hypothetical protein